MPTLRVALPLALCLLAFGCRDELLVGVGSDVSVSPSRIDFGQAWVGHPELESLRFTNRSRVPHLVTVEVSAPFFVDTAELELGGGAEANLDVRFAPEAAGSHEGVLVLVLDGARTEIPLLGEALLPPECAAAAPCLEVSFDPAAGECVEAPAPDDSPCSTGNACVINGRCEAGACLGEALDCDDSNPCTVDACNAGTGCLHLDGLSECPQPTSPCQAAFCDPLTGCGLKQVDDGVACGPADCMSADVCVSGVCKTVSVPDGRECAPSTPCQGKGVCVNQVCQLPPAAPLTPVWTYSTPSDLRFDGVADGQDNLYWSECRRPPGCTEDACQACVVVSADRDGVERWRQDLVQVRGISRAIYSQLLTAGVLVTFVGLDTVEARDPSDGTLLWSRDLKLAYEAQFFDPTVPEADRRVAFGPPSADGAGNLYVPMTFMDIRPGFPGGSLLIALDAFTGATRWTSGLSEEHPNSVVDEAGNVYVTEHLYFGPKQYLISSLTSSGGSRWTSPVDEGRYAAVHGGKLVTGGYASFEATTGQELWRDLMSPKESVLAGGTAWTTKWILAERRSDLVRRDLTLGTELWASDLGHDAIVNDLALTAQDAALMVLRHTPAGTSTHQWTVTEVDASGDTTFACQLPPAINFAWRLALLKDRIVLQILDGGGGWQLSAFDLPGRSLRQSGWVTRGGSNARASAPR